MPALDIENLRKTYRTPDGSAHVAVNVERFTVGDGGHCALRGASGSGKTTLLHLIAGILAPDGGRIRICGQPMAGTEARRDALRAVSIGYIFQTFNLLGGYTALENVELDMLFGRGLDRDWARSLLVRVGLADRLHYRPRQLSVGQQQRVAVARALANRPQLVLADEPTGNLDVHHAGAAIQLIRDLCSESGAALLLVSHDRDILARFDDVRPFEDVNLAARSGVSVA